MDRISSVTHADRDAYEKAEIHWDNVAKPLGSFGLLEDAVKKIASVQGRENADISRRSAVIICGDHGVVCEGVTQAPSSVTAECAKAIAGGTSNINALAKLYDVDVTAVDMGICTDVECENLVFRKIAYGTDNIAEGPAMTREQACLAIEHAMDIVRDLKEKGTDILVTGEMGIGNTTVSSACACAFLGLDPEEVTGRGAGLSTEGLRKKISVVRRAVEINRPYPDDALDVISKVGGYDLAGMTGLFLGGAVYRIPVVIDGVISAAAAYAAYKLNPLCAEYMLASHRPAEKAGMKYLDAMGLVPVIDAGLRLGEGTGGIMLIPLLDGAFALYNNAHRFEELDMKRYEKLI